MRARPQLRAPLCAAHCDGRNARAAVRPGGTQACGCVRPRPGTCERYRSEQTDRQTDRQTKRADEAKRSARLSGSSASAERRFIERRTGGAHRIAAAHSPVDKRPAGWDACAQARRRVRSAADGRTRRRQGRDDDARVRPRCGAAGRRGGGDYALDDDARVRQQRAYAVRHQRVVEVPAAQ